MNSLRSSIWHVPTSKSRKTSLISGFLALEAARRLLTVLLSLLTRLLTAAACSLGKGRTASPSWASVTSRPAWNGAARDPSPAACNHSVSNSPSVSTKRKIKIIQPLNNKNKHVFLSLSYS